MRTESAHRVPIVQSRECYQSQLHKQLRFLERSCNAYDAGEKDEAVRIANAIFTIFQDGSGYQSLHSHLRVRKTVRMCSTSFPTKPNDNSIASTMVTLHFTSEPFNEAIECKPNLSIKKGHQLPAPAWWDGERILIIDGRPVFRKDIVAWARHTGGGAHVGAEMFDPKASILQ